MRVQRCAALIPTILVAPLAAQSWQIIDLTPATVDRGTVTSTLGRDRHAGFIIEGGTRKAVIWNGQTAESIVVLHPPGAVHSGIQGMSEVGFAGEVNPQSGVQHAAYWNGPHTTPIIMAPAGFSDSIAVGLEGSLQAGFGYTGGSPRALAWAGSGQSAVVLSNLWSVATGIGGGRIVGYVTILAGGNAVYWEGANPSSMVDIHPGPPYSRSLGKCVSRDGRYVGGSARLFSTSNEHAMIWDLTTMTYVDLDPGNSSWSSVEAIYGNYQVGTTNVGGKAAFWNGTRESYVDLNAVAGASFSRAYDVYEDAAGLWIVGAAAFPSDKWERPVIWHLPSQCYPNCDNSTTEPVLNVDDFTCFINAFAQGTGLPHQQQVEHYANCDGSTTAPVLNVDDFTCFINSFAAGCP